MDPSRPDRPDRILKEWAAVAHEARRPAIPPRRVTIRNGFPGTTLIGTGLVAAALVVAVAWLGGRGPADGVGGGPSSSPIATPLASPPATPLATPPVTAAPSASATTGACRAADLHARITAWEGAAGQRIGGLEMSYSGTGPCTLPAVARPQLMDGSGSVLIDGTDPSSAAMLTLAPGDVLTTLVQAGNYCGPKPVPPVTVAFLFSGGERIVATPVSPTDATIPPCLGSGQPSDISMHPWAPK